MQKYQEMSFQFTCSSV